MFPFSLQLGTTSIVKSDGVIKLNVTSSVDFSSSIPLNQCTPGIRPVDLLTAREIWIERGTGCCIAIQLRINGDRPADESWRARLAEELGQVLREGDVL